MKLPALRMAIAGLIILAAASVLQTATAEYPTAMFPSNTVASVYYDCTISYNNTLATNWDSNTALILYSTLGAITFDNTSNIGGYPAYYIVGSVASGEVYTWHFRMTPQWSGDRQIIYQVYDGNTNSWTPPQTIVISVAPEQIGASFVSYQPPASPAISNIPNTASFTYINTGNVPWDSTNIHLVVYGQTWPFSLDNDAQVGTNPAWSPSGRVLPGQSYTWHIGINPLWQGTYGYFYQPVFNNGGNSLWLDTARSDTVTISPALFTSGTTEGATPLTVQFNCPLQGSYQWNFGDGTGNSTSQNPTHTYSSPGVYDVSLTYSNGVTYTEAGRKYVMAGQSRNPLSFNGVTRPFIVEISPSNANGYDRSNVEIGYATKLNSNVWGVEILAKDGAYFSSIYQAFHTNNHKVSVRVPGYDGLDAGLLEANESATLGADMILFDEWMGNGAGLTPAQFNVEYAHLKAINPNIIIGVAEDSLNNYYQWIGATPDFIVSEQYQYANGSKLNSGTGYTHGQLLDALQYFSGARVITFVGDNGELSRYYGISDGLAMFSVDNTLISTPMAGWSNPTLESTEAAYNLIVPAGSTPVPTSYPSIAPTTTPGGNVDIASQVTQATDSFYQWGPMLIGLFTLLSIVGFIRLMTRGIGGR